MLRMGGSRSNSMSATSAPSAPRSVRRNSARRRKPQATSPQKLLSNGGNPATPEFWPTGTKVPLGLLFDILVRAFTRRISPGNRPSVIIPACRPNRHAAHRHLPTATFGQPFYRTNNVIDNLTCSPVLSKVTGIDALAVGVCRVQAQDT